MTNADIIDLLAGVTPGSTLDRVRAQRPQAREHAQRSFEALLEPCEVGGFPLAERYAVATFVAGLHGFGVATRFYADLLDDEAPRLTVLITQATIEAASRGPFGEYREPGLAAESTSGTLWQSTGGIDAHLAAALAHTHLLVFRPREANPDALHALVRAGWDADDIVRLSQLVSFLTFQLRVAWSLRALGGKTDEVAIDVGHGREGAAASDESAAKRTSSAVANVSEAPDDLPRPDRFTQDGLGWVPWLEPVAEADLSDDQREALLDDFRRKSPYFRLLVRDADTLRARTLTDLDIFLNENGGVGRAEREIAATATSRLNGCVYCASVHSAAATRLSGRADDVQRLLDDGVSADLGDDVWNAIAASSAVLAATPLTFGADDVTALRSANLDDASIVDVVGAAAFFNWANRLMISLGEPEIPARRVAPS